MGCRRVENGFWEKNRRCCGRVLKDFAEEAVGEINATVHQGKNHTDTEFASLCEFDALLTEGVQCGMNGEAGDG